MNYLSLKILIFAVALLILTQSWVAEAFPNQVCPLNPEKERILSLQEPYISGHDVADLQQRLKLLEHYDGPVNSIFDQATAQAVVSAQESLELFPDGTVDQRTMQALVMAAEQRLFENKKLSTPEKASIIIDMDRLSLTVFDGSQPIIQYTVAMGKYETPTPVGNWEIISKSMTPSGVMGTRWMGLNIPYGTYGIHGTNAPGSIGSFASHGCIRMHNSDVEDLFPMVTVGTSVTIVGTPFGAPGTPPSTLSHGSKGPDVLEVQRSLKRLGYLQWNPDGFWGEGTERAVKKFRLDNNLKGSNVVDVEVYKLLGL